MPKNSTPTQKRILVFFLADIECIKPETAASYLVKAGLKEGPEWRVSEMIKIWIKENKEFYSNKHKNMV